MMVDGGRLGLRRGIHLTPRTRTGPMFFARARRVQMARSGKVGIGILGSQFVAEIHAESYRHVREAELVGVASPTPGHAERLAQKYGIPHEFTDYRQLLEMPEVELVDLCLPNSLHCQATVDAAN